MATPYDRPNGGLRYSEALAYYDGKATRRNDDGNHFRKGSLRKEIATGRRCRTCGIVNSLSATPGECEYCG